MKIVNKSVAVTLAATVICALATSSSFGSLLFSDAFDYTAGSTLGGDVNPGNSTAWTGGSAGLSITNANLTYSGLADQGGNAVLIQNASATTTINTYANQTAGTVFYSFLFDPLVANGGNNYFVALNAGASAPGGGSDAIDAYSYSSGKMELRANALAATPGTGSALTLGTTYFIVEEYDIDNKIASLWINPTPGGAMPTATATLTGAATTSLDDIGLKAQSSTGRFVFDNVLVGTTWGDVTPTIPEPSTFALMGLGLGLIAVIRRRRS